MSERSQRNPWRQTVVLSMIALAVFTGLRWLPLSGGSLHYTDFNANGQDFLEFCEPGSPQFAPVDRVRSPVTLSLSPTEPMQAGVPVAVVMRLVTAGGKTVNADDLLIAHTEKLHLLIIDASLRDYQHVHPQPGREPGSFEFTFTPQFAGRYRAFADFTPRATGRALYAGAALTVGGPIEPSSTVGHGPSLEARLAGLTFRLTAERHPLRINQNMAMEFSVARDGGGVVVLEPVMGAPAHLVAFDANCTGFAHLHPTPADPQDAGRLGFSLNLPDPGFYRVWAQVKIEGRELFVPFGVEARP